MSQQLSATDSVSEADQRSRPVVRESRTGLGRDGRDLLARAVEQAVVPRLVAMPWVRRAAAGAIADCLTANLEPGTVDRLVALCLEPDSQGVALFIAGLHEQGVPAERLYTEALTPAARILGDMWASDECTFAETTLGVIRLQNAQRALAPDFVGTALPGANAPRFLLMPVPGEQHTFGLSIVLDFFRRAGWDGRVTQCPTEAQAIATVRGEHADLIGLSFACDERIDTAQRLIAEFRRVARNPDLVVLVGGPSFVADPALAARVGADGTAADGHQAVLLAHELVHPALPQKTLRGAGQS